jgi:maleate cis-trans isomerase
MTPFDESINKGIREYLAAGGIEAISAPQVVPFYRDAIGLEPEEVFDLTKAALEGSGPVDAVYFQGAVLDPMLIIERIEEELRTTLVASNPAMLWFMLSKLGFSYQIHGSGRLLEEWPKMV